MEDNSPPFSPMVQSVCALIRIIGRVLSLDLFERTQSGVLGSRQDNNGRGIYPVFMDVRRLNIKDIHTRVP
jgi:hypothetical protein